MEGLARAIALPLTGVGHVAFSPDGRRLRLRVGHEAVKLWGDAERCNSFGDLPRPIRIHDATSVFRANCRSLAFNPTLYLHRLLPDPAGSLTHRKILSSPRPTPPWRFPKITWINFSPERRPGLAPTARADSETFCRRFRELPICRNCWPKTFIFAWTEGMPGCLERSVRDTRQKHEKKTTARLALMAAQEAGAATFTVTNVLGFRPRLAQSMRSLRANAGTGTNTSPSHSAV